MLSHTSRPRPRVAVHSPEEVAQSLADLTSRQDQQLESAARCLFVPSLARIGWQPADLVQEAKLRTLSGKRHWRIGVSLVRHLRACMRSLVSSLRKGEARQPLLACEVEHAASKFWSLEETAARLATVDETAQKQVQKVVQQLRHDGAELALQILHLLFQDKPLQAIQRQLDLSHSAYCYQLRKIRLSASGGSGADLLSPPAPARSSKKSWSNSDQINPKRSIGM